MTKTAEQFEVALSELMAEYEGDLTTEELVLVLENQLTDQRDADHETA